MTCSREGLANIKIKWLGFASTRITEHILTWYCEKLQREFIPIPITLFSFPYFYSHSRDIVIVTPIPMGIPWDPNCSHSRAHLSVSSDIDYFVIATWEQSLLTCTRIRNKTRTRSETV